MGWRGTLRSVNATLNQIERENKRRQKERDKYLAIEEAAVAVREFEDHLDWLTQIHQAKQKPLDWQQLSRELEPIAPVRQNSRETSARQVLEEWKPNWFHKKLGTEQRRRTKLENEIENAIAADQAEFEAQTTAFSLAHKRWKTSVGLAKDVLKFNPEATIEAVEKHGRLETIGPIGKQVRVTISDSGILCVDVELNPPDIIPDYYLIQTQSGKLSERKMPAGRRNSLYLEHVASSLIAVAARVLSVVPADAVLVNGIRNSLVPSTGHHEDQPYLSVWFVRETLEKLYLERVEAAHALENFVASVSFKKTAGLSPVKPVIPPGSSFPPIVDGQASYPPPGCGP
ncbi:hypothetical protein [Pyruvatibacter mobilis]|uniref:hypothetical protein n=1 Tax=Pyruvatibacter mobilis TaxID=1712261 RepID=UPI003D0E6788